MKLNHRQIVRHASYLAKHPTTRRGVIVVSLILFLGSLGITQQMEAANHTVSVNTKALWESGTTSNIDTEASPNNIQLTADGAWNAKTLAEPFDTLEDGATYAGNDNYLYVARGGNMPWFWRYNISSNSWTRLADAPYAFMSGSDSVYASTGYVYAVFGGYQKKFARYVISSNTWQELDEVNDVIYTGASLAYDYTNDKIYLLRANGSAEFYKFTPNAGIGAWSSPTGPGVAINAGGDLLYYRDTANSIDYLYAFSGGNGLKTYRYNITTPGWADAGMADFPAGQTINSDNNATISNGVIYVSRSATAGQIWLKYVIATSTWTTWNTYPNFLPLAMNSAGGLIAAPSQNRVYVFRGTSTRTFWSWNTSSDAWVGVDDPIISTTAYTITTGSTMVSDGSRYLYVLRGGSTNLLRYDNAASAGVNPWSVLSSVAPNVALDTYGVRVGSYIYFITAAATLQRFYITTPGWQSTTLSAPYNAFGNGSGLVYTGTGDTIYANRGNGAAGFYSFDTSTAWPHTWSDAPTDLPQTYQPTLPNVGARMFTSSTDVYMVLGNGSNRMMRYNISGNAWYEDVAPAPFNAYYGTAVHSTGTLAYFFAGYYKNDFYEYNISGNTWRKLRDMEQAYTANLGPYNGAVLSMIGTTIYGFRGTALTDFYTYTVSSSKYANTGSYVSTVSDLSFVESWTSLTTTGSSTPGDSSIVIKTSVSDDMITWDSEQTVVGTTINSALKRYLHVSIYLTSSTDRSQTPTLGGYTVTYVGDSTRPSNPDPAYVTGKDQEGGSVTLTSGSSYGYNSPYFTWPAAQATGGAADAGSGVQGYYVAFATTELDPSTPGNGGTFTENNFYEVNAPLATGTYYLRIMAVDNDDNEALAAITGFTYVYNGVSPTTTKAISSQAEFTNAGATLTDVSATQSTDNLQLLSAAGTWTQESLTYAPANIYVGGRALYRPADGLIYVLPGNARTFYSYNPVTNAWNVEGSTPIGLATPSYGAGIVLGPGNYLYGWLGNSTTSFLRYDTSTNTWDNSESVAADLSVGAGNGAAAVYDGYKYIYFQKGTSDDAFWRYDTSLNTWETGLPNTVFGNGSGTNYVYGDSQLIFDGNRTIYSIQSGGYTYFGKYTIPADMESSAGTWTALKQSPISFTTGATLEYDSVTNSIFAFGGNAREQFAKYSIATDSWTILCRPPLSIGYGATLTVYGTDIYALRGNNTTAFWKYDITNNVWKKPVPNVFGTNPSLNLITTYPWQVGAGARIIKGDGDYYYATRGNLDVQFARYNYKTSEIAELAPLPMGITTGASIIYTGSYIYATTGSNSQNFYKYTISTNSWSKVNTFDTDLVPGTLGDGSDLAYDGSQYIYLTRGATGAQVYRFDTLAGSSRWSTAAVPNSTAAAGAGGNLIYANDPGDSKNYLFMARGASLSFYQWEIGGASWSDPLAADPTGAAVAAGGSLSNGLDGYLYLSKGNSGAPPTQWYRYYISGNTWSVLNNAPAGWGAGGTMSGRSGEQIVGFLGQGTNAVPDAIYTYTQQTSTTSFVKTGTYLSESFDTSASSDTAPYRWANLTANYTTPSNTSVAIKTQSSTDNVSWSDLELVTNEQVEGNAHTFQIISPARQYIRVQATLSSNNVYTPTFNDYTIKYYLDETAPTNPSEGHGYSAAAGSEIYSANWQKYTNPKFTWPAAGAANGATDNAGGSGVAGYSLYFGTSSSGNPVSSSGIINASGAPFTQTGNELQITNAIKDRMTQGQTYYLNIKTYDGAGNHTGTNYTVFTYKYDSNPPPTPGNATPSPLDYTTNTTWTFTWAAAGDNSGESGIYKYQYRTGEDGADEWFDVDPLTATTVTLPNANHPNSKYTDGANAFYLRVVDNAGNASVTPEEAFYYYFGTAPSTVTSLDISPDVGYTNSFTATWGLPTHFVGDESMLRYRYSIGDLPDPYNTVELSSRAVGPTSLANKYGENRIYVVAYYNGTDISSIPWGTYATETFDAFTSEPNPPRNMRLADTSERDLEEYSVAIKWERPTGYDPSDPDFAGFKIYRSLDGVTFGEPIATTTGTAYVDDGLSNELTYYYKVTAYTKSGQESDPSDIKNILPTGKYSQPPTVITSSVTSSVFSKRVIFEWITTRTKGSGEGTSFAKCGRTLDSLDLTNGTFDQVIQHEVTVEGFTPDTAYFCNLYSSDIDGNTAVYGPISITTAPPSTVKDVEVSNVTLTEALITWETSVPAKGKLSYFETVNNKIDKEFPSYQTSFSVKLSGLKHTTNYNYSFYLTSEGDDKDVFGQDVTNTFSTLPEPVVTDLAAEPVLNVDTPTLKVTYITNVDTTAVIYYTTEGQKMKEASNSTPMAKSHEVVISGMLPLKTYTLTAGGSDAFGNAAVQQTIFTTTKDDTKPPEVTSFITSASPQTDGKTVLEAKIQANEPVVAQMEVATGSGATTFPIIGQESPLNQAHNLSVTVNAGTIYTVRVKLTDSAGNVTYSKSTEVSGGIAKDTALKIVTKTLSNHFSWFIDLVWKRK